MAQLSNQISAGPVARVALLPDTADISLTALPVGIDNIHYDVFLSPRFVQFVPKYLMDLVRQCANIADFFGMDAKSFKPPESSAFRKHLADLLQASLTQAKFAGNIEQDILLRLAVTKFIVQETSAQFTNLVLECKQRITRLGAYFERSEQAHVMNSRVEQLKADRPAVLRRAGQQLHFILSDLEEKTLARSRRALFGSEYRELYDLFANRLLFVEGAKDDFLFLELYFLPGSFKQDPDRFELLETLLIELLRDEVITGGGEEADQAWKAYDDLSHRVVTAREEYARLDQQRNDLMYKLDHADDLLSVFGKRRAPAELRAELSDVQRRHNFGEEKLRELESKYEEAREKVEFLTQQYRSRLGDYLNQPENARRLFDSQPVAGEPAESAAVRAQLLSEFMRRLEERGLLLHVIANYELREIVQDYCPPIHVQQLKKALLNKEEMKRVLDTLQQYAARRFSTTRLEEAAKSVRKYPAEKARAAVARFAEDFMRLRRDLRNVQRVAAWMERINLVRDERTRELSRMNSSLNEFLIADEAKPAEDRVVSHVVIKADVRGSTKMTQDLVGRGLNPASHFSLNLYEPVKRILERFSAARVFIEGDAIILAIYETESNRAHQRAVAKACLLGREILSVAQAYNAREQTSHLPRLELGVGVAFQNSAPTYWVDSDYRLMISRALNLSDRLAGCSKAARRMLSGHTSPFNLFVFQTVMEASQEEEEEFLLRYNLNGMELNEEGFAKLSSEISLSVTEFEAVMPWGKERVECFVGEVPIGESQELLVIRRGIVRQLKSDGTIGGAGSRAYFEVCTNPEVSKAAAAALGSPRKS